MYYRATAYMHSALYAIARPSVRLSVCLSYSGGTPSIINLIYISVLNNSVADNAGLSSFV